MLHLRSQAATQAVQFTVEKQANSDVQPIIPHTETAQAQTTSDIEATQVDGPVCTMQEMVALAAVHKSN